MTVYLLPRAFATCSRCILKTRIITSKRQSTVNPLWGCMIWKKRCIYVCIYTYTCACCILFLISWHPQISPPQFLHSRMSSCVQSASSVSCKAYASISHIEEQIKLLMLQLVTKQGDRVGNLLFWQLWFIRNRSKFNAVAAPTSRVGFRDGAH